MPCDTRLKPRQTITQRKAEIRKMTATLESRLKTGAVKVKIDAATGAVAFVGLRDDERDGVTDGCAYRRLMSEGSAATRRIIAEAERAAGVSINKRAVAHGVHSHDGGKTWHHGH